MDRQIILTFQPRLQKCSAAHLFCLRRIQILTLQCTMRPPPLAVTPSKENCQQLTESKTDIACNNFTKLVFASSSEFRKGSLNQDEHKTF